MVQHLLKIMQPGPVISGKLVMAVMDGPDHGFQSLLFQERKEWLDVLRVYPTCRGRDADQISGTKVWRDLHHWIKLIKYSERTIIFV
jgi:hypothetical protein